MVSACNNLDGGSGNDTLEASAIATGHSATAINSLSGGAGNDRLEASAEASAYSFTDARNVLDGGLGHDTLIGRIVSGAGGSELHGGDGDDDGLVVYDGTGNLLDGGAGVDLFTGGTGDDRFRIDAADLAGGGIGVNGQRGNDTIDFDLDLTQVSDTVFRNIEAIDLRDSSGQELALSASDVLAMTDARRLHYPG